MTETDLTRQSIIRILSGLAVAVGLYLASRYHYLLFHTTAELFSIIIAVCVFVIAWNARLMMNNNYLMLLGISYLFIGGLDMLHVMAYKGMEIIHGFDDDNLPPQIWLVSRYLEAASLIAAPFLLHRRLRIGLTIALYAAVCGAALLSIFWWQNFPACFVKGAGLTHFKKASEYLICLLLVVAMWLLYQSREEFDPKVRRFLYLSMLATIGTELCFTVYIHLYGLSNLVGHYLKIISFYFIYKAIVQTGLLKPYDLLFRELKKSEDDLRQANELLARQAKTDPLTGICNRLRFEEMVEHELARASRYHTVLSLVMFDIDHFKQINDRFGHHAGDQVLKQLTALVGANVRQVDTFARWGGEEFMILIPDCGAEESWYMAEKLRQIIESFTFAEAVRVTCSFGIAGYRAGDTLDILARRADAALYRAKDNGRNRIVATQEALPVPAGLDAEQAVV